MKKKRRDLFEKKCLYWFENELIRECSITRTNFHKVRGEQWERIYKIITDKFVDKTQTWKNGLHWANVNGYSPNSMKEFLGSYQVNYLTWFQQLHKILPKETMVYFLIDKGNSFYKEKFWIFESYIPELIKVLDLLNRTAFLDMGWLDYYIVSKKYKWLIGFDHHDMVSLVGKDIKLNYLKQS